MEKNIYKKSEYIKNIHYFGNLIVVEYLTSIYYYDSIKKDIFEWTDGDSSVEDIATKLMKKYQIQEKNYNSIILNVEKFYAENKIFVKNNHKNQLEYEITGEEGKFFPKRLQIELTNTCNLNCKHCYKSASNKNVNMLSENIYYELLRYISNKVKTMAFTGGEPLLHPSFRQYVFNASKQCERLELNTNGTLIYKIDIDIIKLFNEISITLYGIDEDSYSSFCGVRSAFQMLNRSCQYLKENKINFLVNILVNEDILKELEQYVYTAIKIGAQRIRIGTISKIGRAVKNINLDKINTLEFERKVYRKVRELEEKYRESICFDIWQREVYHRREKRIPIYLNSCLSCNAGNMNWAMNEKGEFKPCVMLPEDNDMVWSFNQWKKYVENKEKINWTLFFKKFDNWCYERNINIKEYCEFIEVIKLNQS